MAWLIYSQVKQMDAKDKRIKLINEIISGVKVCTVLIGTTLDVIFIVMYKLWYTLFYFK